MEQHANGNKYAGEFKDGKKHGWGTFYWPNGGRYVGEWKDDVRTGQGTEYYSNGGFHDGAWKDGKEHGPGMKVEPDGGTLEGNYVNGKVHGIATGTWTSGRRITGLFENGVPIKVLSDSQQDDRTKAVAKMEAERRRQQAAMALIQIGSNIASGRPILSNPVPPSHSKTPAGAVFASGSKPKTPYCGIKPIPKIGCRIGRCVNGAWEQICDKNSGLSCGIRPIPNVGCQIGRCVDGDWEQVCN